MKKTVLSVAVHYDETKTDPESLATAFDKLLETAMSIPRVLEEYGEISVEYFSCPPERHRQ